MEKIFQMSSIIVNCYSQKKNNGKLGYIKSYLVVRN